MSKLEDWPVAGEGSGELEDLLGLVAVPHDLLGWRGRFKA